jgi:hypothetical protein
MKQTDLIVLALAGVAVYMIVRSQKPATTSPGAGALDKFVGEIFGTGGTPFSNGWRYFENGTAIAPNGDYYHKGQLIWRAGR